MIKLAIVHVSISVRPIRQLCGMDKIVNAFVLLFVCRELGAISTTLAAPTARLFQPTAQQIHLLMMERDFVCRCVLKGSMEIGVLGDVLGDVLRLVILLLMLLLGLMWSKGFIMGI